MQRQLDAFHVFLVANDEGDENIAAHTPTGRRVLEPMIASTPAKLEQLTAIAQDLADRSGKSMTVAYFIRKRDVETITPRHAQTAGTPGD